MSRPSTHRFGNHTRRRRCALAGVALSATGLLTACGLGSSNESAAGVSLTTVNTCAQFNALSPDDQVSTARRLYNETHIGAEDRPSDGRSIEELAADTHTLCSQQPKTRLGKLNDFTDTEIALPTEETPAADPITTSTPATSSEAVAAPFTAAATGHITDTSGNKASFTVSYGQPAILSTISDAAQPFAMTPSPRLVLPPIELSLSRSVSK